MSRRTATCLIFNPAFPVLGGGERYTLALGRIVSETHDVTYAARDAPDPTRVAQLGFEPFDVTVFQDQDFPRISKEFDVAVVVTLEPPPPSFAGRSLVVVQFPRGTTVLPSRFQRRQVMRRLRRYHAVVYSQYALDWLRRRWRVDGTVLMPGIELGPPEAPHKENLILSVARFVGAFSDDWNNKRQDVLIEAFSQLPHALRESWQLVLAGASSPSREIDAFIANLRQHAAGLNITIETNITADRLADLQQRARLFWHATGFERPASLPEQAEHFGISTGEAMSHGVVPLVFADGGQIEIVTPECGYLWRSIPELVEQSTSLMSRSPTELDDLAHAARAASERFGSARFEVEARELLERLGLRRSTSRGAEARTQFASRLRRGTRWALYRATAPLIPKIVRARAVVLLPFRRFRGSAS